MSVKNINFRCISDVSYRISKDQNGGYGTANDYGDGLLSKILKYFVKSSIDFPPLYSVQVCGELLNMNHDVVIKEEDDFDDYDLIIMPFPLYVMKQK